MDSGDDKLIAIIGFAGGLPDRGDLPVYHGLADRRTSVLLDPSLDVRSCYPKSHLLSASDFVSQTWILPTAQYQRQRLVQITIAIGIG